MALHIFVYGMQLKWLNFLLSGASEMLMANAVQELASKTPGKEAVAIEAFAAALRQVCIYLAVLPCPDIPLPISSSLLPFLLPSPRK